MSDFDEIAKNTGIDVTVVTEEDLSALITMTDVHRTKSIVGIYSLLAMALVVLLAVSAIPVNVWLWRWALG